MRNLRYTIFYMKTNVLQDFHISIRVPLHFERTFEIPWKSLKLQLKLPPTTLMKIGIFQKCYSWILLTFS